MGQNRHGGHNHQQQSSFSHSEYPPPLGSNTGIPANTRASARATYPQFLSVQETALLQLRWALRGLYDAFRWNIVISTVSSDAEIRANVSKSLLLNGLSIISIYIFDLLLQPLVKDQQKWFHRNIGWFYQILWLLPIVGMSLYLNGTWCTTIARRTYLLHHGGRPVAAQPTTYTSMLKSIATSAYRVVMVGTSVIVSFVLGRIPWIGPVIGFIFMCWVDSYYCFEFVWISRGLSLSRRIQHLEERWAYYLTFGLPATALCMWGSSLANAAIFALIFPAYIIMAMHARPYPVDPYNPYQPTVPSSSRTDEEPIRHPSPFIPIRLPIFAIIIFTNDSIVRVLNFIGGRPVNRHKYSGSTASSATSPSMRSRGRAFSDAEEHAEGGNGGRFPSFGSFAMKEIRGTGSGNNSRGPSRSGSPAPSGMASTMKRPGAASSVTSRPSSSRVSIAGRKKLD
ncbi:etoposide-induced protein 2.4-domain-containing protein [Crepidotus variabilis]|uniref:Etoposide-induced protein 2.4-domain-containing protein n=1 Tax=Crepidotus variabilis TaxID=179855 RepID=A0A9P6EPA1_9AGAR|nr:etoposide-induced protein 2.4-domain-containing protein [Crepidotus variabilis]